jgi:adenine deaminase
MEAIVNKDRPRLAAAALGKIPCDLTIENARVVNVITGEIIPGSVDVLDGVIVRVRDTGERPQKPAGEIIDACGHYVAPGLIDTHVHIESTMLTPQNFGRAVCACGTTCAFTDPHEIANVMGVKGVLWMLRSAKKSPARIYTLAPSCVPAAPGLESSGAQFGSAEIDALLGEDTVVGIAELMDVLGVVHGGGRMSSITGLGLSRGVFLQGHAPGLHGGELDAYRLMGPGSDHESGSAREIRERLRAGMRIDLRFVVPDAVRRLTEGFAGMRYLDNVSLCTDDVYADDLLRDGHVNRVVRQVIGSGIDPVQAYRMAAYQAAAEYGFSDLGAVAPGFAADLQILRELDGRLPEAVYINGKPAAKNGECIVPGGSGDTLPENTVRIPQITSPGDLLLRAPEGAGCSVKTAVLTTRRFEEDNITYEELPVTDGCVDISRDPGLCWVAVINRYGAGGTVIVPYRGYPLQRGAVASTISHDSHNMTVIFRDTRDAYLAARELLRVSGGITAVCGGEVLRTLPLPCAGLMSPLGAQDLAPIIEGTKRAIGELCPGEPHALLRLTLMSLPCDPCFVVTDLGIVDGKAGRFVPQFI